VNAKGLARGPAAVRLLGKVRAEKWPRIPGDEEILHLDPVGKE
jgi:hypothetical protein